jgi:hypothetical protein
MRCLTVDPVWAWAIMERIKQVENRTWRTNFRGRLGIHAGLGSKREHAARALLESIGIAVPESIRREAILGSVVLDRIEPCAPFLPGMESSPFYDPLAQGPWCWILRDPRHLPFPIFYRGQQGLWHGPKI